MSQQRSIAAKISQQFKEIYKKNRKALGTLKENLLFCVRQDINLQGHRETKKVCFKNQTKTKAVL